MIGKKVYLVVPLLGLLLAACNSQLPTDVATAYQQLPAEVDFNYHVRPILSDRCFSCHGPDENTRKAGLRLDVEAEAFAALKEGHGYALIPRKPFESEVVRRILSTDPDLVMPTPESKMSLNALEKATLIKWLEQGAEWKNHWSFIAPRKAAIPTVENQALVQSPIDHFILKKLEEQGLSFSEKADKSTLIRRVYLDLIGLPPSLEDVDVFLADDSPRAFEKVVDRLLASPSFGERWAWDWLDAARYADTNGFQGDPTRKMYPWRDWVIRAINNNMPYDQFTVEQLAGDLLPDATDDQILATAFNRNHMYNGEGGRIPEETRVENVFDRVETTGTVFMGLTLNCTRCHDHKFDPITQKEYFQFYDYFNQTSETGLNGNGMIPPVLDLSPPIDKEKVAEFQVFIDKIGQEVRTYEEEIFPSKSGVAADSPAAKHLNGDDLYVLTFAPEKRNAYYLGLLARSFKDIDDHYAGLLGELKTAINNRNRQGSKNLQVMVMDEIDRHRPTFVLDRGAFDNPTTEQVEMDVPKMLPPLPENAPKNRLALAQWLVAKEHPLTARVTVNRFWQALFVNGLVKTADDFGIQGTPPSHPSLLDGLAVDFVESGWDVKALIRQIVLSRTYQQSSKISPEALALDPDNKWLGRSPRHRMPAWKIRDQALAISGLLHDTLGGISVKPYQPEGVWAEATFGKIRYKQDQGNALYRRTLYTFWRRIVGPTMLFDNSTRQVCSVKPSLTNSPQHALITLNDITFLEAARVMAERVLLAKTTAAERMDWAFRLATCRLPTATEQTILQEQLQLFADQFAEKPDSAAAFVAVGEYRQNEQLDIIEQAVYTAFCSMLLNLDEVLSKQ